MILGIIFEHVIPLRVLSILELDSAPESMLILKSIFYKLAGCIKNR